jgi:hypothetical protein
MTRAEAKRQVCAAVATFLDPANGHENAFLYEDQDGDLAEADVERMKAALQELVDELDRRGRRKHHG